MTVIVQHVTVAVMQEPGIDIVLDPTDDLECCLATALTKAQLRKVSTFAPVADQEQRQKIRELCAMWDMDLMLHGMAHVSQHCKESGTHTSWFIVMHSVWLMPRETADWFLCL